MISLFKYFFAVSLITSSLLIVEANDKTMPLDEYLHDYNSVLYNNPSEVISNAEFLIRNLDNKKNIAETYLLLAYGHFYAGKK